MAQGSEIADDFNNGRGPRQDGELSQRDYTHPAAGWGAAFSVGGVLIKNRRPVAGTAGMLRMNHEGKGFDCPGCAWPDDRHGLMLDLCENGVKHTTWEMTPKRVDASFFERHTVAELSAWTDYELEEAGRLTEPLVYDEGSDKYVPISWDEAFRLVGDALRGLDSPHQASFYTSGRLSNEATFLYQWWAREFGTNNLPDCSNMCHEASGRALEAALGTGKGLCDLPDWEHADLFLIIGVNAASNAPRMLTSLGEASKRGAQIIHINPMIEAAARDTIVPHDFLDMALLRATKIGDLDVQVRIGGDMAVLRSIAKVAFERAEADPDVLDRDFIAEHTAGFEEYRAAVARTSWAELVRGSGVAEETLRELADRYLRAERAIVSWCLGVTQHENSVDTIREIVNVLMLRGHIGKLGSGPSPVRGHSNVQGNRTCGIDNRPAEEWLARFDAVAGVVSPRERGLDTVDTLKGLLDGTVKVFVALGGNFVLAVPDTELAFRALRRAELTVQVSTKLNRSHLVHGRAALILPCFGRTEQDLGINGNQQVTAEDAMSYVNLSQGKRKPASPHLRSEVAILAGMASATLPESKTPWAWFAEDYDRIRDVMAEAIEGFDGFNRRVREPLGFRIAQPARDRVFRTKTGKAEFHAAALPDIELPTGQLMLATQRSHDQWNTTIYSNNDRYRGVKNSRTVLFMNAEDMAERGFEEFARIDIESFSRDGRTRKVTGYQAVAYKIPRGNVIGYMPELNVLCGLAEQSGQSDQPLMKHVAVRVTKSSAPAAG
ncbi:FdhF/YdeP family oxidoreductase [Segniliparus rugosus]|uniref:Oxidoreductase alpha (Molybdopterin) subunit n=1 Tax=Segniliparus rugosus (strain ATCC BAA-974 / DSM 45345 / CCUG 50838 / CIP 108380 / JCM 13579 / CDC 945) TaxID=679197 RepID=E5XQE0_SEGRC|nr:FdhF/YdeP family oxidoreductase [Segniliparus rugosus]EFV13423.1 oxidoreductase alpha (molybdopterin) subunit [Segniliparus rugosus ATCC BAA-974]